MAVFIKTMATLNLLTAMEAHQSNREYIAAVRRGTAYIASLVNPNPHGAGQPRKLRGHKG